MEEVRSTDVVLDTGVVVCCALHSIVQVSGVIYVQVNVPIMIHAVHGLRGVGWYAHRFR